MLSQRFLSAKPTLAHIDDVVLRETCAYLQVISELKEKYGEEWIYHKILYPEDTSLVFTNWPNLSVAAKYYAELTGSQTMARYQVNEGNISVKKLKELVTIEAPRKYFKRTGQLVGINTEHKLAIARLGIDLNAFERNVESDSDEESEVEIVRRRRRERKNR